MKSDLSSLGLHYVLKELSILKESKIDRIYHASEHPEQLLIVCHVSGEGKKVLTTLLPSTLYLSEQKNTVGTPTGLCMMLRKYLEGARIKQLTQHAFERVIDISCENKIDTEVRTFHLIIELFSKGNIIFTDDKYTILNVFTEQQWKDREIKRTQPYVFPTAKHGDITQLSEERFAEIITQSTRESLVKTLAIELSLGGVFAEEVCARVGVDKNKKSTQLDNRETQTLYTAFKELFAQPVAASISDGTPLPFHCTCADGKETQSFSTYSAAIEYAAQHVTHEESRTKTLEKIQKIIDEQEQLLREAEQAYLEEQKKGETIYKNYQEISEIIETIKKARKNHPLKEIKERIAKDEKYHKIIKDIDEKNNTLTLTLENEP